MRFVKVFGGLSVEGDEAALKGGAAQRHRLVGLPAQVAGRAVLRAQRLPVACGAQHAVAVGNEPVLVDVVRRGIEARVGRRGREELRRDHLGGLVDTLIVGAFVEARSCERFARLAPLLDTELSKFYRSLLRSEGRHFEDYLALANLYSNDDISARVDHFAALEQSLIESPDTEFRFHSGVPS